MKISWETSNRHTTILGEKRYDKGYLGHKSPLILANYKIIQSCTFVYSIRFQLISSFLKIWCIAFVIYGCTILI